MMKKLFIGFLMMSLSIAGISQTKVAQISFEKLEHDFKTIKEQGGTVTYKFEFVNTGGNALLVSNVRPTCGCTSPEWTRNPIPPGGKGYVAATFDPKGRPNAFSKYLYVDSNSEVSNTKLTIKGVVTPKPKTIEDEYRYEMGGLRLKANHLAFGNVKSSETKDFKLEIINNSEKKITLGFDRIPGHVKIKFSPEVLKPKEVGHIIASYDASMKKDWGMLIDRLNVTVNGVSERAYRLVISANIIEDFSGMTEDELAMAPAISVDDPEANFGKIKQKEKFEHVFVVTNTGKSTLLIRKIKTSCGCTAVQPEKKQIEPGESIDIKTIFNSAGKRGNQSKNVTIITNDPNRSNLILRIKGEVLVEE